VLLVGSFGSRFSKKPHVTATPGATVARIVGPEIE
jgi:hypothetical protein